MQTTSSNGQKPAFVIWFAPDRKNAPWTQIGAMWPTSSGEGFRVVLQFIPNMAGNIVALQTGEVRRPQVVSIEERRAGA